jgi:hypothetical protein
MSRPSGVFAGGIKPITYTTSDAAKALRFVTVLPY